MTRLPRTGKPIPDAEVRWEALHAVVPVPHRRDFLWLSAVRLTDGTRVDLFVHTWTMRGVLLGDDGAAFGQTPTGRYKQSDRARDVERALPHRWEWLEMGGYVSFDVGPEPFPDDDEEFYEHPARRERWRPRAVEPEGFVSVDVTDADLAF